MGIVEKPGQEPISERRIADLVGASTAESAGPLGSVFIFKMNHDFGEQGTLSDSISSTVALKAVWLRSIGPVI